MDRKSDKPKSRSGEEIVVFSVVRASQCTECGEELWKGSLLRLEGEKALCMGCADLDRLEFLPAGEAAVTRRASKYSKLRVVRHAHTDYDELLARYADRHMARERIWTKVSAILDVWQRSGRSEQNNG